MKALLLALCCSLPAAAWDWPGTRAGEAVYEIEATGNPKVDNELADRAAAALRRRAEAFGLAATVERRAGLRVAATLSSRRDDPEVLLRPLLKPSRVGFHLARPDRTKPGPGDMTADEYSLDAATGEVRKTARVLIRKAVLTASDIESAYSSLDAQSRRPFVSLKFTPDGARKLAAVTAENVGKPMAVVVDGRILSMPVIHDSITGGALQISGDMSEAEVRDYAKALSSGPLPERLKLVRVTVDGKELPAEAPAVVQVRPEGRTPAAPAPAAVVSDVDAAPAALARGKVDGVAVVIGIETSRQGLPRADFAARDAKVFADYLTKTLGYAEENVKLLLDERAAKSDLEKYLEDWLPRKAAPGGTVVVFFSGHGAPDAVRGSSYLVPYDGDPAFLAKTAYPLARLYETLGRLKGRRSIVLLDACFSGAGKRSALAKGARPLVAKVEAAEPPPSLAVLSAAASNQIGGSFDAQGHGLFTYFVLRSLRDGAAKGRVPTMQELYDEVAGKVEAEAQRLTGNEQTPQLQAAPAARNGSL